MEFVLGDACMLCGENTAILATHCIKPFLKYITNTFCDNNKQALQQFQQATSNGSLCALCTHKVIVSHKFKDIYEEKSKKRTTFKKNRTACFLCESKVSDFIKTDDNPNDFKTKIKSFMDSTLYPRPFMQCMICFDCLFYLSIWFELNLSIMKKVNIEELSELKKPQTIVLSLNNSPNTKILRKDKENITPPGNATGSSRKRLRSEISSPSSRAKLDHKTESTVSVDNGAKTNQNRKKVEQITGKSEKLCLLLKSSLKHLKSIKQINGVKLPEVILEDKKMFSEIPFVLVAKNKEIAKEKAEKVYKPRPKRFSKLSLKSDVIEIKSIETDSKDAKRRSNRLNKPIETIELSDTDSVNSDKKIEKSTRRNGKNKTVQKKALMKIRLSANFVLNTSPTFCNICDREFKIKSAYKAHKLWHEKPESVIINLVRHNLPKRIKASEFNKMLLCNKSGNKNKGSISDTQINKLVRKYIDSPEVFEDTDFNQPTEINNIIDNLALSDSEEKSKSSREPELISDASKAVDAKKDEGFVSVEENQDSDSIKEHANSESVQEQGDFDCIKENEDSKKDEDSISVEKDDDSDAVKKHKSSDSAKEQDECDSDSVKEQEDDAVKKPEDSEIVIEQITAEDSESEANVSSTPEINSSEKEKYADADATPDEIDDAESESDKEIASSFDESKESQGETDETKELEKEVEESEGAQKTIAEETTVADELLEQTEEENNKAVEIEDKHEDDKEQSEQQELDSDKNSVCEQIQDEENDKSEELEGQENTRETGCERSISDEEVVDIENQLAVIHGESTPARSSVECDEKTKESDDDDIIFESDINMASKEIVKPETAKSADKHNESEEVNNVIESDDSENENERKEEPQASCSYKTNDDNVKRDTSTRIVSRKRKRVGNLLIVDETSEDSRNNSSDIEIITPKTKRVRFAMDYQTKPEENECVPEQIFEEAATNCRDNSNSISEVVDFDNEDE